jgi:hypothetical protein
MKHASASAVVHRNCEAGEHGHHTENDQGTVDTNNSVVVDPGVNLRQSELHSAAHGRPATTYTVVPGHGGRIDSKGLRTSGSAIDDEATTGDSYHKPPGPTFLDRRPYLAIEGGGGYLSVRGGSCWSTLRSSALTTLGIGQSETLGVADYYLTT